MYIEKVHIVGFRCFKDFTIKFDKEKNVIVGDNGTGKSTILEAIHLCLSGQHRGQSIKNALSPFLFNTDNVHAYIAAIEEGNSSPELLPKITIEIFLAEDQDEGSQIAWFEGDYNIQRDAASGIRIDIEFNDIFQEEYAILAKTPGEIKSIPIEYYHCIRQTFSRTTLTYHPLPIRSLLIDTSTITHTRGFIDVYLNRMINERLDSKDRVLLSGAFRQMKESFSSDSSLSEIMDKITSPSLNLTLAIDPSVNTNWESLLVLKMDNIPFHYAGKGQQCMVKTHLALAANNNGATTLLLEEPENHLSHANLHKFLSQINENNGTDQIIVTTHSSLVSNKLDLGKLILLGGSDVLRYFKELDTDTRSFFQKVSGFDSLRVVLSKRSILVEGPCDDLIIQRAYLDLYGRLPIEDGIDVISVSGIRFKRYLALIDGLENRVAVLTDNDGISQKKSSWYEPYKAHNIEFFFSEDDSAKTLEPQIIKANKERIAYLHSIVCPDLSDCSEDSVEKYMLDHKTDVALRIFESKQRIVMPPYILNAIKWIRTDI